MNQENFDCSRVNLYHERNRLKSFDQCDDNNNVDKKRLAKAGFFYDQREKITRCYFCNVGIGDWDFGDNPFIEHKRLIKNVICPFIYANENKNVSIEGEEYLVIKEFITLSNYTTNAIEKKPTLDDVNKRARHSDFIEEAERLKSFEGWCIDPADKEELADCGLFYMQRDNFVKCFCCTKMHSVDFNITDDEDDDSTIKFSNLHYPECYFLNYKTNNKATSGQIAFIEKFMAESQNERYRLQPKSKVGGEWKAWDQGWDKLVCSLNEMNGATKTKAKWQYSWTQRKCNKKRTNQLCK